MQPVDQAASLIRGLLGQSGGLLKRLLVHAVHRIICIVYMLLAVPSAGLLGTENALLLILHVRILGHLVGLLRGLRVLFSISVDGLHCGVELAGSYHLGRYALLDGDFLLH